MTILEEIALRQSLMFGGIFLGLGAAAVFALFFCFRGASRPKTVVKSIPMLALAAAGYANFANPFVIVALLLSAIGDIALARDGEKRFLLGLIAFAAAHLSYILYFTGVPYSEGGERLLAVPLAPAVGIICLALSTEYWLAPFTGGMKWPVRIYVILIAVMGVTALSLPLGRELALIGVFAFIASDTLLAIQLFRLAKNSSWQTPTSICLWVLYVSGQLGIFIGAGFARPLFQI